MTVATVRSIGRVKQTEYGTGFILLSEENYSLVFTHFSPEKGVDEYFIYFTGENGRNKAHVLCFDEDFVILIIQTAKKYPPVIFSDGPLGCEFIFTIGATGATTYNVGGPLIDN